MAGRHRRVRGPARHRKPPRHPPAFAPALVTVVVVALGGLGAAAALVGTQSTHRAVPIQPQPTSAPTTAPTTPSPIATLPTTATVRPQPVVPDFAVTTIGGVSWVQVVGPRGRVLYAGLLRHGRSLSYPQRPLAVTIGDAGAVRLALHHRVHAPAGRRGAVLRFVVR